MSASNIYTRKFGGLDKRVWVALSTVFVLSLGLLAYKVVDNSKEKTCTAFTIKTSSLTSNSDTAFLKNEIVNFELAGIDPAADITWDFGDNTKQQNGKSAAHKYQYSNNYTVKAIVNGRCDYVKRIIIRSPDSDDPIATEMSNPLGKIIGNPTATVNLPISFSSTAVANDYTWTLKEVPGSPAKKGPKVKYEFTKPGLITVVLILDNDPTKKITKLVRVMNFVEPEDNDLKDLERRLKEQAAKDKNKQQNNQSVSESPQENTENKTEPKLNENEDKKESARKTLIADKGFQGKLDEIIQGQGSAENLYKYLYYEGGTNVVINGSKTVTFDAFCKEIFGKKDAYRITEVSLNRDEKGIFTINVGRERFEPANVLKGKLKSKWVKG